MAPVLDNITLETVLICLAMKETPSTNLVDFRMEGVGGKQLPSEDTRHFLSHPTG